MIWILLATQLVSAFGSIFGDPPAAQIYFRETAAAVARVSAADEDRQDELEAYFEDLEAQLEEDRAELERLRGRFWEIDRRHDATLEDYERVFTDLEQFWERSAKAAIALAVAMRAELTPAQWHEVVADRRAAAQALRDALAGPAPR